MFNLSTKDKAKALMQELGLSIDEALNQLEDMGEISLGDKPELRRKLEEE